MFTEVPRTGILEVVWNRDRGVSADCGTGCKYAFEKSWTELSMRPVQLGDGATSVGCDVVS